MSELEDVFQRADEVGIRLEIIRGLAVWELHPNLTHQKAIDRIRQTITPDAAAARPCACLHYADLHIKFPDGSDKRPDIAIFCQEPTETETAVTAVPEAVIEIISRGYEAKDLELGPPFYLSQGVRDVIVYDPYAARIDRFGQGGHVQLQSPATLALQCGCQVTI
jgi:hypothetical protein